MSKQNSSSPYTALGKRLKILRTRASESLAEVAGAVEIDVRELADFELGHSCPSEDVLLLLISHFGARDEEAVGLWEAAGYHLAKIPPSQASDDGASSQVTEAEEKRVLFTDVVDVIVNNYGVVMNFMQSGGPNSMPAQVARVGMSREHAKSVLKILQVTLDQTERGSQPAQNQTSSENNLSANN